MKVKRLMRKICFMIDENWKLIYNDEEKDSDIGRVGG